MRALTTDLSRDDLRPYFLWDEDTSGAELREVLRGADPHARQRLLGKLLREARDTDVWIYVTPGEVAEALPHLTRHLGRRKGFWQFVINQWRELGLVQ